MIRLQSQRASKNGYKSSKTFLPCVDVSYISAPCFHPFTQTGTSSLTSRTAAITNEPSGRWACPSLRIRSQHEYETKELNWSSQWLRIIKIFRGWQLKLHLSCLIDPFPPQNEEILLLCLVHFPSQVPLLPYAISSPWVCFLSPLVVHQDDHVQRPPQRSFTKKVNFRVSTAATKQIS